MIADPSTSDPLAATEAASPASTSADGSRPPVEVLAPGTHLGRYVIERLLGCGGMGSVYAARDPELRRQVAIKILHPHLTNLQARLRREGQAIAKLRHPNVITIYDVGNHGDMLFIAMELVSGETLRTYLLKARPWREVLTKFIGAGRGLAAAHASELVHRDFKPDNVLLGTDGTVVVTDFGLVDTVQASEVIDLSKLTSDPMITQTGMFMGTPAYMAPEQFLNAKLDHRTDQFSFCVALWEALYGSRPFRGANIEELRESVLAGKLPKPSGDAPSFIHRALVRGLSIDPTKRFASMSELIAALERRPWFRSPVVLAGLGVAVAGAAIAVWIGAHRQSATAYNLHVGSGRPIERSDLIKRSDLTLLHDGRLARVSPQGELATTSLNGGSRRAITLPIAGKAVSVSSAGDTEMVVAIVQGAGCAYWAMSIEGGDARELTNDADCRSAVELSADHASIAIGRSDGLVVRDANASTPRWQLANRIVKSVAWSPDGRKLALVDAGGTVILDAASGTERGRFKYALSVVWLDNDRLVALANAGFMRTELRLLEVASAREHTVQLLDGQCSQLSSDGKGILLSRFDQTSQAYVVPTAGTQPVDIDSIAPLETESEMDFVTVGWTPNNELVTLSLRGDDRALVRTPLHGRATTLISHRGPAASSGIMNGEALYHRNSDSDHCEMRAVDVTTGGDRQLWEARCDDDRYITSCAPRAGRCLLVSRDALHWIDPKTGVTTPATNVNLRDVLSPDATEVASTTNAGIVIRSLAGKPERTIVLAPPLQLTGVQWTDDQHWLVSAGHADNDTTELALVASDGTWRPLATSVIHQLLFPELSADGSQLALVGRTTNVTWQYFPIE